MTQDIKVVLSDLGTDAVRWDSASEEFAKAVTILENGAKLPFAAFDGISYAQGAETAYNSTLEQLHTLLRDGAKELAHIADRLRATATNIRNGDYEAR
jgi:hypothetical protein